MHTLEALNKAFADNGRIIDALMAANKQATALESLVILPLIGQARELRHSIDALRSAMTTPAE